MAVARLASFLFGLFRRTGPSNLGVDIEHGFIPKYQIMDGKLENIRSFLMASKKADQVLIASDDDREGEAIAFHVKDCLAGYDKPIKRVKFGDLTKTKVLEAVNNPVDLDENLYKAQQARRVLDRIVGFLVSQYVIKIMHNKNLSAGRTQSVAVRMIAEREKEIEEFIPEEYWNIFANLSKNNEKFQAKIQEKVTNKTRADEIKKDLEKSVLKIKSIKKSQKPKYPEPPFKTSTLLIAASDKYGLSNEKTTKAAQSLYEGALTTYPRPDSVHSAPEAIVAVREFLTKNGYEIPDKPTLYENKNEATQGAHEALRPTDLNKLPDKMFLPEDEMKIYRLVWEKFVASQMKPAIFDTVDVIFESSIGNHILKASGKVLSYQGWLAISSDLLKIESKDSTLPILEETDEFKPLNIKTEQKFTNPPARFSEGSLVKELEKRGIGRPSTFAAISSKIAQRSFIEKRKNIYYPTDLGRKVMDILVDDFDFMQYAYTAEIEKQLDLIQEGKLSYIEMMSNFFEKFNNQLHYAYDKNQKDYGFICELCQNPMYLKHGYYGFYLACKDYPIKCKNSKKCEIENDFPIIKESLEKSVDGIFCPKCSSSMIKKDFRWGPFYCCSKYPRCQTYVPVPVEGIFCNQCSGPLRIFIKDDIVKLACINYKTTHCSFIIDVPDNINLKWTKPMPQIEDHYGTTNIVNRVDSVLAKGPKEKIKKNKKKT
jgi:DNA topoisomerase-1